MSQRASGSRFVRKAFEELRARFEALALEHPSLEHFYTEYPCGSEAPFPSKNRASEHRRHIVAPVEGSYRVLFDGTWVGMEGPEQEEVLFWESWYEGDGADEFEALAEIASEYLEVFRVGGPPPDNLKSHVQTFPIAGH